MARKKKKDIERKEVFEDQSGEISGEVILKDGNQEGLLALVKLSEEVNVEQDHDSNVKSISFSGKLNVENPSTIDRIWDIDITLANIEATNLKSNEINIRELGTEEPDNVNSRDLKLSGEVSNLLLVKEFINTLPDADDVLNINDIETNLLKLKATTGSDEDTEEDTEVDEDGGIDAEGYSLESFGIAINQVNNVTFVIALQSQFEKAITDVKIVKNVPAEFSSPTVRDSSIGMADLQGDQLIWEIDVLEPETTAFLKFAADIQVDTKDPVKTGSIEITYKAASSFTGGLEIESFDAFTRNKFVVDIVERDEAPGVWDCKLVFENPSEFMIELYSVDVHDPEDPETKFVTLEGTPKLPSGAQWNSGPWEYESDDYPAFRRQIDFRVLSELQAEVNGTIAIDEVELFLSSITGEIYFDDPKIIDIPEEDREENVIYLPSYKDSEVPCTMKYINDGSGPLDEVKLTHKGFDDEFKPPTPEEVKLYIDGKKIPLDPDHIIIDDNSVTIDLKDLKNKPTGMLEPDSVIEVKYPVHAESPPQDSAFTSDAIFNGNTYPLSAELEIIPPVEEIPVIKIIHIRRKYRVGKEVMPIGDLGQYQILLHYENLGDMPLRNFNLLDKVPDNFEYSNMSMEPEITDEVGFDALKWGFETLDVGDTIEITYDIKGSGKYSPSDAQLAL